MMGRTEKLPNGRSEQQVVFFDLLTSDGLIQTLKPIAGCRKTLSVTHIFGREPLTESGPAAPPCCTLRHGEFVRGKVSWWGKSSPSAPVVETLLPNSLKRCSAGYCLSPSPPFPLSPHTQAAPLIFLDTTAFK